MPKDTQDRKIFTQMNDYYQRYKENHISAVVWGERPSPSAKEKF